jgi:hypothetical protein
VRPLHLVLDASAVEAYAAGSEHVGEPLTQVTENAATFTAPLTVLATAASRVDPAWVELLTAHPAFTPVGTDWSRWPGLSASLSLLGRIDAAEALLVALGAGCDVLTADPDLCRPLGEDPPAIAI